MVVRRPHTLMYAVALETLPPYKDENGDMVFPEPVGEDRQLPCRLEENANRNAIVKVTDGTLYEYKYKIFADTPKEPIPNGTYIEVVKGNEVLATGHVAKYAPDQRQCRIWV